ncbi:hypothetical protein MBENS4_2602 [Novosphingobium sp. MBES04]|nr:hypothetical protein MBENS4_2602 [Novosphingobium sp. MBES04]
MTTSATTKETTKPIAISLQPTGPVPAISSSRCLTTERKVAPTIVGTARKKLNSAAVRRSMPMASAPMMVAPERLVPGTMARHWAKPTPTHLDSGSSATPVSGPGLATFSMARMAMPPTISAQATTLGEPSRLSIQSLSRRPSTAEGMNATTTLRTKRIEVGLSSSRPMPTAQKVRQKWAMTARIAPSWMTTLNVAHISES